MSARRIAAVVLLAFQVASWLAAGPALARGHAPTPAGPASPTPPGPASPTPPGAASPTPAGPASPTPEARPAAAKAEPIEPDASKIMTSDPFTVEPGWLSITPTFIMTTSSRYYDGRGSRTSDALVRQGFYNLSLTYGLAKNVDLAVDMGDSTLVDLHGKADFEGPPGPLVGAGLTDLTLGLRWKFHEDRSLAAAHTFQVIIPSGSNGGPGSIGITQGYTSLSYRLSASRPWGRWSTTADLGVYGVIGRHSSTTTSSMSANLAAGYQCAKWFQPVVELTYLGTFYGGKAPSRALGVTAGGLFNAGDFSFTLGVQKTVWGHNTNDTLSTIVSASYGFSVAKPR